MVERGGKGRGVTWNLRCGVGLCTRAYGMGHTSFLHCITYGMVFGFLCCDSAGYWEVIPL